MKLTLAKASGSSRTPDHVLKTCHQDGCNIKFTGHPVRKYCDNHIDPKKRPRKKIIHDDISVNNRRINHTFTNSHDVEYICAFDGCKNVMSVRLHPKTFIYPKYCDKHKQEHKRRMES